MAQQQKAKHEDQAAKNAQKWEVIVQSAEDDFQRIAKIDNVVHWDRESKFALQIIMSGSAADYLQKCSITSVRNAVTNVASVGLTLNPIMKLAYLVPRKGQCCLDISYMGLCKLATDTGSVAAVKAEVVREKDMLINPKTGQPGFIYNGPFDPPTHHFNPFDSDKERGEVVGVYVWAKLNSGINQIDVMSREEIDKIRKLSKAESGPWYDWFVEMCKKTALKRAYKLWPRTERLSAAEAILNEHEGLEELAYQGNNRRPSPTEVAEKAARDQQEKAGTDDERAKLIKSLEALIKKDGLKAYATYWSKTLTKEQRQLVGKDEHNRLKNIGVTDVEPNKEPT